AHANDAHKVSVQTSSRQRERPLSATPRPGVAWQTGCGSYRPGNTRMREQKEWRLSNTQRAWWPTRLARDASTLRSSRVRFDRLRCQIAGLSVEPGTAP